MIEQTLIDFLGPNLSVLLIIALCFIMGMLIFRLALWILDG